MLRFLETISLKEIQHEPLDFFFLFFYLLGATFFFPFEPPTIENKRRNGAPCHYSFRVFPGISIKETRDARERPISRVVTAVSFIRDVVVNLWLGPLAHHSSLRRETEGPPGLQDPTNAFHSATLDLGLTAPLVLCGG